MSPEFGDCLWCSLDFLAATLGSVVMGQNVGPLVVGATFAVTGLAILFVRS